ncbi:hypothetical protein B0H17DRAFT_1195438 [Mycena rosella]|uniref:Uncharacterized protein n=1 Tax=Mycena rosella TaxID=1033263 RepID=A0AAD7DYU0_MYCRO|nr:hypothetical protein B0H17DRAFT_1195438 [Mycena rosella]
MCDNLISQFQSSILLGALSLIPNDALRYTLLVIAVCLALFYVYHLERPSTQLSCLEDVLSLAQEGMQLSRVQRLASRIRTRLLETESFTWKEYRLCSRNISDCTKNVKQIRTAIQLIVEAEHQRKYTEDINEIEVILTSSACSPRTCSFIGAMPTTKPAGTKPPR